MAKSKTYELMLRIGGKADSSLRKACEAADAQLAGLGETAEKIMSVAGTAMKTLGAAAVAGVTASVTSYAEYEQAAKGLASATGATGKALENQDKAMQAVYKSGYGENLEDIAETIAVVERNVDNLSGKWTETAENAKAAIALEKTFGYGTEETTRAASALMKNFGGDAATNMSLIAAGAQKGLDFSGELIDTVSEYSSQFSKLGFTADGMFNLLQSGADSTAWNLDKVGDAIKEFSIRSIDGSKTTTEAFKTLGFDHNALMQTFAVGGEAANKAFFQVLDSLMATEDLVKRDSVGVALFGTMWEDLGTEAMQAMANASQGAYDTQNALAQIQKTNFSGLTNSFEKFKRSAQMILADVGEKFAPAIQDGLEYLSSTVLPIVVEKMDVIVPKIIEAAQWGWENRETIVKVGAAITGVVAAYNVAKTVLTAYNAAVNLHKVATHALATSTYPKLIAAKVKDKVETLQIYGLYAKDALIKAKNTAVTLAHTAALKASALASKAAAVASKALGAAVKFMTSPMGIAITTITALVAAGVWLYKNWDTVKEKAGELGAKISAAWDNISLGVQNAISAISGQFPLLGAALSGMWTSVSAAWENVKGVFAGIIDFIDNVFAGNWSAAWQSIVNIFGNVFGLIVNLAKVPINGVISAINFVIEKINGISFSLPDWGILGEWAGKELSFNLPTIPQLATGGIAVAPTLAEIGEGGEPEAVLPLSKLASMLGSGVFGGGGTWTFAPNIIIQGNASRQDVEDAVRMSFEEFKRMWRQLQEEEKRKKFS